jgi:alpha-glucosidase
MARWNRCAWVVMIGAVSGVGFGTAVAADEIAVTSPDGKIKVTFDVLEGGKPVYSVMVGEKLVVAPSRLGFTLSDNVSLAENFRILDTSTNSVDTTWTQVWGEEKEIRDHHNELAVMLQKADDSQLLKVIFRVFDGGLGFRYEIPKLGSASDIKIMDEHTEFALTGNHRCWWIPAFDHNRYEYTYRDTPLQETDRVHTPITFQTAEGLYLSIHEAALTDFSSMALKRTSGNTYKADLFPWSDGVLVRGELPMKSPWRTLQIADTPGGLITDYLILNLNEPSKIKDTSWIKPGKYVGIWWEMHIRVSTWHSGDKHGATTENTKKYIDFAAKNGFAGVLVEGWNLGWDGNWIENGDKFDFTTPYPDYDLKYLAEYAKEKGVSLIGHHETGGGIDNYERQLEDAYTLLEKLGIKAVKSGYVEHGCNIERTDENGERVKEWHHGQYMVRHYRKVVEMAAKHHVMLNVHEPIKATGIRRTWPNMMAREGAKGQEFNAWGGLDNHNAPDHTTILPFTRLLGGPMDFTPGVFNLTFHGPDADNRVRTTLAKQLALYVVLYSPLQMACDLPENYEARPRPFQFIKDVPADWATTRVLDAAIGDHITIVRQDRNSDDWYLGSITDENPRTIEITLDFLDPDRTYLAEIYRDGDDADWKSNPYPIEIEKQKVTQMSKLTLKLAPGGGTAIRFVAQ